VTPKGEGALSVDLIRTVAITLVILLHASIETAPTIDLMSPQGITLWWTSDVYNSIARTCVPLFVMLTGALLLQPSKTDEPLGVFFKKRWKRVGLPIIFWTGVYFVWGFFVHGDAFNLTTFMQGTLAGPYYHFWYLYILIGLYLLTPIIRVLVAHANSKTIQYFLIIWFVGTAIIPLLTLYTAISSQTTWFDQSVFVFTGLVGYFILGAYVSKMHFRWWPLLGLYVVATVWTIFGTYLLTWLLGGSYSDFFLDASSFNVIFASLALFMLLIAAPTQKIESRIPHLSRILALISANTLAIYLLHVIVLESLQQGYFGFQLSITTLNPIIEIPLITALTLLICLAILVPIKKIPHVKDIVG
jgi:surface polysaccharide O-acyltransferase-like enzyme